MAWRTRGLGARKLTPRRLLRVRVPSFDDVERERCRRSLHVYLKTICWPVIEPATPFVDGWHIGAICEHLQAVTRRQIRNLLLLVPPRHTKSICTSVAWPTWAWCDTPEVRFLYASFSAELSTEHAVLSRRVLDSPRYRQLWADDVQLQTDQNIKTHYENTRRGYRISTSVGGTATGRGGDFLICDDPHNLKNIHSDAEREAVLEWYRTVWSTRLNDPQTGCRVIIMQRGHERDLAGYLIEQGGYEQLRLPTEYEPTPWVEVRGETVRLSGSVATAETRARVEAETAARHPDRTIENQIHVSPIGWHDPRTQPGELLCPARFPPEAVVQAKRDLLATGFATQHQQSPVAAEGALFKRAKLRVVREDELPRHLTYLECRAWDMASTEERPGADPDYTAGVKMRRYANGLFVVTHVVRDRFGEAAGDTVLRATAMADGQGCRQREEQEGGSSGKKVIAAHVGLMAGFDYSGERSSGSKITRAKPFARQVDAGNVWLLEGPWTQAYLDELTLFPNGRHDDQVDGSSMAFNELALAPQLAEAVW